MAMDARRKRTCARGVGKCPSDDAGHNRCPVHHVDQVTDISGQARQLGLSIQKKRALGFRAALGSFATSIVPEYLPGFPSALSQ